MFDNSTLSTGADTDPVIISHIRLFLAEHRAGLEEAARLLGGTRWSRRVRKLCADVRSGSFPKRACLRELHALLGLLKLDMVEDLTSDEAQCFADIHPADPRVLEICLLTDELDQLLEWIARNMPSSNNPT